VRRIIMEIVVDEHKFKDLLKNAFYELLEEKKEIFYGIVYEVMEDIALVNAIKEGEDSASVERDKIFELLEG